MCPVPPDGVAQERLTGVPAGDRTPGTGTDDLRAELVALIDGAVADVCASWRPSFAHRAADAVLAAGYVRVEDDDETVEVLRRALWSRTWVHAPNMATDQNWAWASKQLDWDSLPVYEGIVRALLAALRGGSETGGGQ